MSLSRFAKAVFTTAKLETNNIQLSVRTLREKWGVPIILQEKIHGRNSKLLYVCALIGSCVLVIGTKSILCEEKVRDNRYTNAIRESKDLIRKIKDEVGAPGIVVGVSIDGTVVWEEGFGYADIENRVSCTRKTVMRIASISKSITMTAVAKLWQDGKLDLDKSIQEYVPHFPQKTFEGQPVTITCRHLVSHLGGIRHYDKSVLKPNAEKEKEKTSKDAKDSKNADLKQSGNAEGGENKNKASEFELKEYFIKDRYEDIKSSLDLFKDDPLVSKPGTKYLYSTHGWTLVSAIVESASKEQFPVHMKKLFRQLGMYHTYLDVNEALIYNRSRFYAKDKRGHLINAPYVDNSYKWAGGGFLSTVGDLLKFGNSMLYSLQYDPSSIKGTTNFEKGTDTNLPKDSSVPEEKRTVEREEKFSESSQDKIETKDNMQCVKMLPGYLSHKTMETMWSPIINIKGSDWYGMGWGVSLDKPTCQFCEDLRFFVNHSGGAIGASSNLLILPRMCPCSDPIKCEWPDPPKGVVVCIITNLQEVSLAQTAFQIASIFERCSSDR